MSSRTKKIMAYSALTPVGNQRFEDEYPQREDSRQSQLL